MKLERVADFFCSQKIQSSSLSMTGTGLNGAIQVPLIAHVPVDKINALKKVNIISGSCYSYFICQAYEMNLLREDIFPNFDGLNRSVHNSSFRQAVKSLYSIFFSKGSFFNNDFLDKTTACLFYEPFCLLALKDFPENLSIWSYCMNRKENIEISVRNGFGEMNVNQMIRACVSIKFLHGPFQYQDYSLVDPNLIKTARKPLLKNIFSDNNHHLVINAFKSGQRGDTHYVKHTPVRYPNLEMARDMFFFAFNIPNESIDNTHKKSLFEMEKKKLING